MTQYTVEDTPEGYRVTAGAGSTRITINEVGGHGPVELLYEHAVTVWNHLRAGERAERES